MNQIEYLTKIKKYLSRYQQLVKINTSNDEYDINVHSENTLIPLLNASLDADFKNANLTKKNAEAIDLIDVERGIAVQVTATAKISKIKLTLEKFSRSDFSKHIDRIYVFILTEKQRSYSQQSIDKSRGRVPFSAKHNILDSTDLYALIKGKNNLPLLKVAADILELNFSDLHINQGFTFDQFDEFKRKYKDKCITNFSRLNFFGLSLNNKPREVELYSLFVPPSFEIDALDMVYDIQIKHTATKHFNFIKHVDISHLQDEALKMAKTEKKYRHIAFEKLVSFSHKSIFEVEIQLGDIFSGSRNLVVLGDPGAGKSSMIKYSICKILEGDSAIFKDHHILNKFPLRIELHKYNSAKSLSPLTISKYAENLLADEYQTYISAFNLEFIFKFFPTIIFFDGLDEIFDVHERLQVRNDIENFLKNYPNIKGIVTSRFESYQEVSMDSKKFRTVVVKDFSDSQVEDYVKKWYSLQEENVEMMKEEVMHCLEQLKGVDNELKHNPLLLSLILILYRNDREVPTSKLKIYEGCTYTIVDSRDSREKKLTSPITPKYKISIFSALGFWQFTKKGTGQNLTYSEVKNFVKQYLIKNDEYENEYQASQASEEFLSFAKIRSIYFENKFTHKTFLEYFASYYIYSNIYNKIEQQGTFKALLNENIGLSSWAVVLELLICKIDEQLIESEIIDQIIEDQIDHNGTDAILFFLQIIKYLQNVSKNKQRLLFERAIIGCFKSAKLRESKINSKESLFNHLLSLYVLPRHRVLIDECYKNLLISNVISKDELAVFAYEFSILANSTTMIKIVEEFQHEIEFPYLFVLQHYPFLQDEKTYLKSLKTFKQKYGEESLSTVYTSKFNQNLFFGSDKFNWCITFLFRGKTSVLASKAKLLKAGIDYNILNESASKRSALLSLAPEEIISMLKTNNHDSKFKTFVNILFKTYGMNVKAQQSFINEMNLDQEYKFTSI